MVSLCSTVFTGGTCTKSACRNRHDVSRCESCGCFLPLGSLEQHRSGKKHLRNVAANGTPTPVESQRSPTPPSDILISQSVSPPGAAITAPTNDPCFTVSHESGLDFNVEGTEIAGQHSFPPVGLAILVEETQLVSRLVIPSVKLFPGPGTPESCFTVSVSGEVVSWQEPRRIFVSFQAPHAGTFRMCLQIVLNDNTRLSGRKFVILREVRGHATLPGSHVGSAHHRESFSGSNRVDDSAAVFTEEEVLRDSQGTGISVSDDDGVDFGIVERNGLNGQFDTLSFSVTINHAEDFPAVTFVEARIRSLDGDDDPRWATTLYRS